MAINLPRFQYQTPLVSDGGVPTTAFHIWWDTFAKQLEAVLTDQASQLADIATLQAQMLDRITEIEAAQATADAGYRETARINSYPNPGAGILSASDAGADATITVATHERVYPVQGSIDVPDVTFTNTPFAITGLAYSTKYYIYYDDVTLASTTPTFLASTSADVSQVGAATGRHFVGSVTTPAALGGDTSGDGGAPPGGGGGPLP